MKKLLVKHEQFCQNLLTEPSQKDAYLKTFNDVLPETAKTNASRLLSKANVKERFLELLREKSADLPAIRNRFAKFLNDDENPTQSWDAVKTGLRIYGVLDAEEKSSGIVAVQINVNNLSAEGGAT